MSVELQNIVSRMMADSVPEEQIAAVIQQYKQAPPQPEVEQPGKAQTPQEDVTVESQKDTASTLEKSSSDLSWDDDFTFDNLKTVVNKDEDVVIDKYLNSDKYPGIGVQTTGSIGNEVIFTLPGSDEQITVDLRPFTEKGRQETLSKLQQIENYYNSVDKSRVSLVTPISDRQVLGAGDDFVDEDVEKANKLYNLAGYNIKKGPKGYNDWRIEKDGVEIFEGRSNQVQNYLFNNVTDEEIQLLDNEAEKQKVEWLANTKARTESEMSKVSQEDIDKNYWSNDKPAKRLDLDLSTNGMSDSDRAIVSEFLNKPVYSLQGYNNEYKEVEGWRKDKFNQLDTIKDKLSPEGQKALQRTLQYRVDNKVMEKEMALTKKQMYDNKYATLQELMFDDNKIVQYAAERESIKLDAKGDELNTKAKILTEEYDRSISNFSKKADGLVEEAKTLGLNLEVINDNVVVSDPSSGGMLNSLISGKKIADQETVDKVKNLQEKFNKLNSDRKKYLDGYKYSIDKFQEEFGNWSANTLEAKQVEAISNKEYDLGRVLANDFGSGFNNMALSVPMLFGSESAIENYKQQQEGAGRYETTLDYATAIQYGQKGRFALRTTTQQAPNVILAMATSGGASALGVTSTLAAQATIGTMFGINAAGTTKGDLTILQNAAKDASVKLEELEKLKGTISEEEYISQKKHLLEVKAAGNYTNAQINSMAAAAGIVEGGVSTFLGTAPNAVGQVMKLTGGMADDIVTAAMRSNSRAALNAGWTFAKEVGGEVLEEELIWLGNGAAENLILGRDMDWSQWDDIAVTSVLTAGPMNGPGTAYSAISNQIATAPIRNEIKALTENKNRLLETLANLDSKDPLAMDVMNQIGEIDSKVAGTVDGLELTGILLGGDGTRKVMQAGMRLDALNKEAGINAKDSQKIKEDKIAAHIESLTDSEAKSFKSQYQTALEQKQKVMESVNYEGAVEKLFGNRGLEIESILGELDPEFENLNDKEKATRVYQEIKEEIENRKISEMKRDPVVASFVERFVYDGMTWAEAKKAGYEKNILAENEQYRMAAELMVARKSKATVEFNRQSDSAQSLLTEDELKNLEIVGAESVDQMEEILLKDVDPNSAEWNDAKEKINKLRTGKANGLIHDGKYIVFDVDAAKANLENGNLLQGTMMSHEIGHAVDDLAFNKDQKKDYTINLFNELKKNFSKIHNLALERETALGHYDASLPIDQQSDLFYEEYGQAAQDLFMDDDNRALLNKALKRGQGIRNKVFGAFGGDFTVNTGRDAVTYLSNYVDGFQKGQLSKVSKRAIDARKADTAERSEQRQRTSENVGPTIDAMAVAKNPDGTQKLRNGEPVRLTKAEYEAGAKKVYDDIFAGGMLDNLIGAYIPKYDKPPGWTTDTDFIQDTYLELRNHIMGFNPQVNDSLFAWINSFIKNKVDNVFKIIDKAAQGQYTVDLDNYDAMNITSDDDADINIDVVETSDAVDTVLLDNIPLTKEVYDAIYDEIYKTLGTKLPPLDAEFSKNKKISPIVAELQKRFGVKNGPIHKAILKVLGDSPQAIDATLTNPRVMQAIYDGIPGAWWAKNFPKAAVKSVDGIRTPNPDTEGKTNIFTPNWIKEWQGKKIDRHLPADEGLYRGVTSGPPVVKTNPEAAKDIAPAEIRRKFVNGNTVSDIRRNGLDALAMKLAQEFGMEIVYNDLAKGGELAKLFEGRQELFDRALSEGYVEDALNQLRRKDSRMSENPPEIESGALKLAYIANEKGLESSEFRIAAEKVDPEIKQLVESIFELNADLDGGKNKFIQLINLSETLPKEFKDAVRTKKYNYRSGKAYIENVADNFADQTEAFGLTLDANFLSSLKDPSILGFHYRVLDAAKEKSDGQPGRYRAQLEAIQANESFDENLGFNADDVRPMNKDASWFKVINNDIFAEPNKAKALENLEKLRGEIEAANEANISSLVYFQKKLNEAYKNGTVTDAYIYQIHQAQTNLAFGMRSLSALDYVYVEEGNQLVPSKPSKKGNQTLAEFYESETYKSFVDKLKTVNNFQQRFDIRLKEVQQGEKKLSGVAAERAAINIVYKDLTIKGEHLMPNAITMFELTDLHVGDKFNENAVRKAAEDHTQFFGPTFVMDIIDDLGKTSREGLLRITKGLPAEMLNNVYHISGRPALEVITETVQARQKLSENLVYDNETINKANILDDAIAKGRLSENAKGISVLDFDDTLATTKSNILYTAPDGTKGKLNAEEFAKQGADLLDQGYVFDFSEFNKVVEGKTAPLFNKALKLAEKFGTKDMFVLTARPPQAQKAIFQFLKANGLNIPMQNITGLGNSTSEAKALWVAEKVGEGYNDFYFADDALQNVQAVDNMLNQFDVKRKVQQAKLSENPSATFNAILESTKGIPAYKKFSEATARRRGKDIGKYNIFIPPSAEDFKGLLYSFLGKGKKGEQQLEFFNKKLLRPFARASREIDAAKQVVSQDYRALKKAFPQVKKKLGKIMPGTDFTYDTGIRVFLWNKHGIDIPGISKTDLKNILKAVKAEPDMVAFADGLSVLSKQKDGYVQPDENWVAETIASDLDNVTNKIGRKKFLDEFIENRKEIFGDWKDGRLISDNMNKIEALYGTRFREALEDMLWRMENGTNRTFGSGRLVNAFSNWVNNSVGAIMFLNARSAVLQTLSTANFINWSDNNPAKAAMAFANQPQFWKDFSMLFNSDMLKQRRRGLKTDVNQAELANAVAGSKNKAKAAFAYLLKIGFTPTQIADSFAIASGGATFYRNRVKTYVKQGMSKAEAESKAFVDFQEIAEETQQSSRPDLISQQQASPLGRLVLAFQNTPMQYARLTKKAVLDLANGRGDAKTNISKIIYYGAVQNLIFSSLQKALFSEMFEDDEEEDESKNKRLEKEGLSILNSMSDSLLRGMGIGGAAISTLKNMLIKFIEENDKGWNADFDKVTLEFLNLSPPVGSKARKLTSAGKGYQFNKEVIKEMDKLDINNPMWYSIGNTVSALTNVPLDRVVNKVNNIKEALDARNEGWQRVALFSGWNSWDIGVEREEVQEAKQKIKERKKAEKEAKKKAKQKDKPVKKRCAAKTTDGSRCKVKTSNKSGLCHFHD